MFIFLMASQVFFFPSKSVCLSLLTQKYKTGFLHFYFFAIRKFNLHEKSLFCFVFFFASPECCTLFCLQCCRPDMN